MQYILPYSKFIKESIAYDYENLTDFVDYGVGNDDDYVESASKAAFEVLKYINPSEELKTMEELGIADSSSCINYFREQMESIVCIYNSEMDSDYNSSAISKFPQIFADTGIGIMDTDYTISKFDCSIPADPYGYVEVKNLVVTGMKLASIHTYSVELLYCLKDQLNESYEPPLTIPETRKKIERLHKIPQEYKDEVLPLVKQYTRAKNGVVTGLDLHPLLIKKCKAEKVVMGFDMGIDKDGYFVATHRARGKSYKTPDKIPTKELKFIETTG